MNINSISSPKNSSAKDAVSLLENTNTKTGNTNKTSTSSITLTDVRSTIDKATGILQTIVSKPLSDDVIRKLPSDEYLKLKSLASQIVQGYIDKKV